VIVVRCSWCPKNGRPSKIISVTPSEEHIVSHGICAQCNELFQAEIAAHKKDAAQ
jgi:hypothetical protein